jgi:hypothetical protein
MKMQKVRYGNCASLLVTMLALAIGQARAASKEFIYSNEAGSIIRLDRSPDMKLKGMVCAPSAGSAACKQYDVIGVNTPGTYSLEITGEGGSSTTIDYARVPKGTPGAAPGYTEWRSTSPDAPDFLKSFRAPVSKADPASDKYLNQWGGDISKLIDLREYIRAEEIVDEHFRKRGYPDRADRTVPLVVRRPQAASWEAIATRESGARPQISTFSADTDGAVIITDSSVVAASVQNAGVKPYIAKTAVFRDSMIRLQAPVESIFDRYVDPNKRNDALSELNRVLVAGFRDEVCQAELASQNEFKVECTTHTTNYNTRMNRYFVSSLFIFLIGAVDSASRSIHVVQETVGALGPLDRTPPAPSAFKVTPESDEDVLFVEGKLKADLSRALIESFPKIRIGQ